MEEEVRKALTTQEVKEAIGRFRGVAKFFDIGDASAESDGNILADAIGNALAALSSPRPEAREEDIDLINKALQASYDENWQNGNDCTLPGDAMEALSRLAAPQPRANGSGRELAEKIAEIFCYPTDYPGFEDVVSMLEARLAAPKPQAKEDALDFATRIEAALAKGEWRHVDLANRIEMYVESRLAAPKPEGQGAEACTHCGGDGYIARGGNGEPPYRVTCPHCKGSGEANHQERPDSCQPADAGKE